MELNIPWVYRGNGQEIDCIIRAIYEEDIMDYEITTEDGSVIKPTKEEDLRAYRGIERYITDKQISYKEHLDDLNYEIEAEGE